MGQIIVMEELLSNKIAAGEVVERPASVVKELVENAIDAESTSIEIILEEAGLAKIQVTDNGKGMDEADAVQSFSRHATSKITTEHDLFRIRSLGFRGEALASIASVSKISLWTSDGENVGTKVELEGGRIISCTPAPIRRGTDIAVTQLFFNTPARLKYLKTIQTELGHSIDLINRLALSYPNIAFKLIHNAQTIIQTSGRGDLRQVLASIYGVTNVKKMVPFEKESSDFQISGFATMPEITRASKNYITILVNGRWVKHYGLNNAIVDAYHTLLPIGRYPIVVLNIETDPMLTDVNVHPAKHQIRLSKEKELMELVRQTIRSVIHRVQQPPKIIEKPEVKKQQSVQFDFFKPYTPPEEPVAPVTEELSEQPTIIHEAQTPLPQEQTPVVEPYVEEAYIEEVVAEKQPFPDLHVVGQIHGTYIVAQSDDGFYLIDQHAAQERIKYEFYKEKVGEVNAGERQALLLPLTFHYSLDEAYRIKESIQALQDVGIFLEEFGSSSFVVREHPTWFPAGHETKIIENLIEQVLTNRKTDIKKLREEAAIMMSCKLSIKANHYLTMHDMEQLLQSLKAAQHPLTCPHGRPVIVHFSTYEVEKMFKRVM
ncbi:DNA mismatch repair endonuclease MutL [Psychrobacillus lasiicapitis]|uniref:DNA mismatch repair protein MutL n=1 Tax=Psychrobacillus lasiicapitis TaxID=1636719 RepID=A0A544TI39_9BACI|nr:DNA mismatch repair endonuclease MutL [Psychrobacillus lasiicapitis]TQR17078.1 DNA mismatch repair endonuclease MutL [Psychrobacillus lasiicapitis]GGA24740.1 DNA mismatch repair protein MutL [Psychrobacillus lasiicapitis]